MTQGPVFDPGEEGPDQASLRDGPLFFGFQALRTWLLSGVPPGTILGNKINPQII
jgi:hypothetical protein